MEPFAGRYAASAPYAGAGGLDFAAVMRQVYLWLSIGLLVAFGVALALTTSGVGVIIFNPVVVIVALVAYLVLGFGFYPIVRRVSPAVGTVLYIAFAAVFGFLITSVFETYSKSSIVSAFLTTLVMFGGMSLLGYTTRINLARLGVVLIMALIGVIVASVVNIFLHSSILEWVLTYASVVIFAGLTAYDTQWIKKNALAVAGSAQAGVVHRLALIGAFRLFLDFINLFLNLLRIFGGGRQ
ncbi:MAG: Bax inhibitor-1/YccA family protein [Ktedonobacterales bacterium]